MIITLTGPTCAGKSTLEGMLVERGMAKAISTTTRKIREGEVDGESYHFVSKDEFAHLLESDQLVEHVEFGGNSYGLSVQEVERLQAQNKPIVVVCEPIGQKQIISFAQKRGWPTVAVFVDNPPNVIAERFMKRMTDDLIAVGTENLREVTKRYAGRLAEMMGTEQKWRHEAWHEQDIYDICLSAFGSDPDCSELTIEVIEDAVAMQLRAISP